jgi:Tol biopolymer transport system component
MRERQIDTLKELVFLLTFCGAFLGCSSPAPDQDDSPGWPDLPAVVDVGPKWSPTDTAKIAYTHYPEDWEEFQEYGGPTVWVVDIETKQGALVTQGSLSDWSPDGTALLCDRNDSELWLVDLSTGIETRILCEPWPCGDADFAPSGTKIAYSVNDRESGGIWILSLESMTKSHIYGGHRPDWSPDGDKILCDGLMVIREDGTEAESVPYDSSLGYPRQCCWHPDGGEVTFTGFPQVGNERIYRIKTDGSDLEVIAETAQYPSWSPDGEMIAYSGLSENGKAVVIWIVNTDGAGRRQVTFVESTTSNLMDYSGWADRRCSSPSFDAGSSAQALPRSVSSMYLNAVRCADTDTVEVMANAGGRQ